MSTRSRLRDLERRVGYPQRAFLAAEVRTDIDHGTGRTLYLPVIVTSLGQVLWTGNHVGWIDRETRDDVRRRAISVAEQRIQSALERVLRDGA